MKNQRKPETVTLESLEAEMRARVESGEDAASVLKSMEGKAQEAVNRGLAACLAGIQTLVCELLTAPPSLHKHFIAKFEELLLRADTKRHDRFVLSMLLNALQDEGAVRSAAELVAEIEKSAGRREAT